MSTQQETLQQPVISHGTIGNRLAEVGFGLAVLAGITAALSGFGTKWGWWYFMAGFSLLKVSAISGGIAAVLSLIGGVTARHEHRSSVFFLSAAGILIGLIVAGIPMSRVYQAGKLPMIHDITTDMVDPPQFKAVMPLRAGAQNPATYEGPKTAAQQSSAYPDIRPLMLSVPQHTAFDRALLTAKNSGWQIVDSNEREGRIEAVATTFWFGFKDDIVIRVTPVVGGSRVDMRSTSRVGLSDIGTNAERVRTFLTKMNGPGESSTPGESPGY
jgi:uncharacterized protein (DUF1499 family)